MTEQEIISYIQKWFVYDNGKLIRTDRRNSNGSLDKDGYLIIKIKGTQYKAHRLVFAWFNNRFPCGDIDHINHNRLDNRIENLREVSRLENLRNIRRKPNPDTGVIGISFDKTTKGLKSHYRTRINGKYRSFRTVEEAIKCRKEVAQ